MRLIGVKNYRATFEGNFRNRLSTHRWASGDGEVRVVQLWAFGRQLLAFFG